jgi:hypothetical protein
LLPFVATFSTSSDADCLGINSEVASDARLLKHHHQSKQNIFRHPQDRK